MRLLQFLSIIEARRPAMVVKDVYHASGAHKKFTQLSTRDRLLFFSKKPRTSEFGKRVFFGDVWFNNPFMFSPHDTEQIIDTMPAGAALDIIAGLEGYGDEEIEEVLQGQSPEEYLLMMMDEDEGAWQHPEFIQGIKNAGYDGVISNDPFGGGQEYVIFDDKQFMSKGQYTAEAKPKNIDPYQAAVMIAKDDDLFDTVSQYVGDVDVWDRHPRELAKFIAILNLIKPYNQRLYRGERGYFEHRDGTTHYYETNYPFTSWSLNKDTARDFAEGGGIMSYTDGPIKAVSLSDIATARMRMFQGESHYSGMQAEHFVLEPVPREPIWNLPENRSQLGKLFPVTISPFVSGNKLMESMNFYPSSEKDHPKHGKVWSSVLPDKWTSDIDREKVDWEKFYNDFDYEAPENPEYRPELDLNLANANMSYLMRDILGFEPSDTGFHMPIDEFLTKAQIWLQKQLGQTTPELPSYEEPREFKRQVTTDPDTGLSTIGGGNVGPRMIHGGRREGYDNETIMRMVKIASLGKEMGATHVSAF